MNPAEHKYVIKKALERYRIRMEEVATLGWYKDSTPTDNEIARIDAALAWLEQEPTPPVPDWSQAPEWAMWWAVDPDGYYHWFDNEPILTEQTSARELIGPHWSHFGSKQHLYDAINIPIGIDWRTLKAQRPATPGDT